MTKGLAPAGGCTARKYCIETIAIPTANAAIMTLLPNSLRKTNPTKAAIKCPKMTFLGWANGDWDTTNKITQLAPKGAIIKV